MRLNVGVDWGHEHVQFCIDDGQVQWQHRCAMKTADLQAAVDEIRRLAKVNKAEAVAVAIERKEGRLVHLLLEAGFEVWFVRPDQVDDARKLRFASKAKDDRRDARTMSWMLGAMPESLRRLQLADELEIELKRATRTRAALVVDRTGLKSQLIELFREVFPEMLGICHPDVQWFGALWRIVRTPSRARSVPPAEVAAVLKSHHVRKTTPAAVIATLRASEVRAGLGDWTLEAEILIDRLDFTEKQIDRLEKSIASRLEAIIAAHQATAEGPSDPELVDSLPGAGQIITAVLIAERLPALLLADMDTARAIAGVAPVLATTGKAQTRGGGHVGMRYACSNQLRNALHLLVEKAIQRDQWIKARYSTLRQRGQTHGRACRQVADGLLHRLRAMLRDRTLYVAPNSVQSQPVAAAS